MGTATLPYYYETEKDLGKAHRLLEKAEKNCLISHSIKTKVELEPEFVKAEEWPESEV